MEFDKGAKDITRVFFTTTASEEDLLYLDDRLFETDAAMQCCSSQDAVPQPSALTPQPSFDPEARYNGVLFSDIIAKYWELFNGGKEPVEGDRNALTFELAVTLRSICGYSLERLMQVIPNYWRPTPSPSLNATPHFYVAFQIIGKYLFLINCYISNSYTISRDYDDFWGKPQPSAHHYRNG